jgi:putative pyruvate formate lyase activating enzyme
MDSMELMDGIVDIYMPDFKYWDSEKSRRYLGAGDYPEVARKIFLEMYRQVGPLRFDDEGPGKARPACAPSGHAGRNGGCRQIFRFLAGELSRDTWVNIMDQYHPDGMVLRKPDIQPD